MSILNIFRPKYKNSNPNIRIDTLISLRDKQALQYIIENDNNGTVIRCASRVMKSLHLDEVEKISDQNELLNIILNDADKFAREIAVKQIHDEVYLLKIIRKSTHQHDRAAATKKLNNQSLLKNIISKDSSILVKISAISQIRDTKYLNTLKDKDDVAIINAAINRIADLYDQESVKKYGKPVGKMPRAEEYKILMESRVERKDDCVNELLNIISSTYALNALSDKFKFSKFAYNDSLHAKESIMRDIQSVLDNIENAKDLIEKINNLYKEYMVSYMLGGGLIENPSIGSWPIFLTTFSHDRIEDGWCRADIADDYGYQIFSNWLGSGFRKNHHYLEVAVGRYTKFASLPGVYISS